MMGVQHLPLCNHPLTRKEADTLLALIGPVLRYLNAPGDWGYGTQLGTITQDLYTVRAAIQSERNMMIEEIDDA